MNLAQMIIPIYSGDSGPSDPIAYLALWIFSNLIWFSIFTVRFFIWLFWKRKVNQESKYGYPIKENYKYISFWRYCIWDDSTDFISLTTMVWLSINAFAVFAVGSWWIYHLLGGTMPLF